MLTIAFNMTTLASDVSAPQNGKKTCLDDQQDVMVTAKQPEFVIKLKSNPTTGYTWFLQDYDTNLIAPVKHSFQAPNTNLVGASGYEEWTFRVKPAGFVVPRQINLSFIYARPWKGGGTANQMVFHIMTGER